MSEHCSLLQPIGARSIALGGFCSPRCGPWKCIFTEQRKSLVSFSGLLGLVEATDPTTFQRLAVCQALASTVHFAKPECPHFPLGRAFVGAGVEDQETYAEKPLIPKDAYLPGSHNARHTKSYTGATTRLQFQPSPDHW